MTILDHFILYNIWKVNLDGIVTGFKLVGEHRCIVAMHICATSLYSCASHVMV
jgi:hypothetical protein